MLRKYHDENENGQPDPGEPPLEGIPFEFTAGDEVHRRVSDADGAVRFCMDRPATVGVREMTRETGGVWRLTSPLPAALSLSCPPKELWVGNARVGPPKTGGGAMARKTTPIQCGESSTP